MCACQDGVSYFRNNTGRTLNDRDAIKNQIEKFIGAYCSGDLDGVMNCYSHDLIKTRHGAQPENYAETRARLADVMRDYQGTLDVVNHEINVSDGMAFARGELSIVLTPRKGGEALSLKRRFLEIWEKHDGQWLVTRTMDNVS